jgi:hypothetical protein
MSPRALPDREVRTVRRPCNLYNGKFYGNSCPKGGQASRLPARTNIVQTSDGWGGPPRGLVDINEDLQGQQRGVVVHGPDAVLATAQGHVPLQS